MTTFGRERRRQNRCLRGCASRLRGTSIGSKLSLSLVGWVAGLTGRKANNRPSRDPNPTEREIVGGGVS